MSRIFLGLGSNLGDRKNHLEKAITELKKIMGEKMLLSPVYETPAVLPEEALAEWKKPYLNLVMEAQCELEPTLLLRKIKEIEKSLGRNEGPRWVPRVILMT